MTGSAIMGFSARLHIGSVPGEHDAVTVQYDAGEVHVGPVRMAMPRRRLARTGLEEALTRRDSAGLGKATFEYAEILRESISEALSQPFGRDPAAPALIVVHGLPSVHHWMWESLWALEPGSVLRFPRVLVVHVPNDLGAAPERGRQQASSRMELTWIGARPHDGDDLPRYLVLGPVLEAIAKLSSGIRLAAARSNADAHEMEDLLHPMGEEAGEGLRICHLDAHGVSRMQPGDSGSLVDAAFSFQLRGNDGPDPVRDNQFMRLLSDFGCDIFTTNACFGAQQRSPLQYPFPGLLVRRDTRLAIAAREPLQGRTAQIFFGSLYAHLADGNTVLGAYAEAAADLIRSSMQAPSGKPVPAAPWDLAARWAVQMTVWARSITEIELRPGSTGDDTASAANEYLSVCALGGLLADLASAIEDDAWSGQARTDVMAIAGCDLSEPLLGQLVDKLHALLAPPSHVGVSGFPPVAPRALGVPGLTVEERLAVVARRFTGPSTLLELLAHLLPGDVHYLDELAERAAGDAADALLHALSWGSGAILVPADRARDSSEYIDKLTAMVLDNVDDERASTQWFQDNTRNCAIVNIAIPILGRNVTQVHGAPVPEYMGFGTSGWQLYALLGMEGMAGLEGDAVFATPFPWRQLWARRELPPERVLAIRLVWMKEWMKEQRPGIDDRISWNTGTKLACLAWLAFAVAARQEGAIDPDAFNWAVQIIGAVDYDAAVIMSRSLRKGLPGWQPTADELADIYVTAEATIAEAGASTGAVYERNLRPTDPALQAMALWHQGRSDDVLALTTPLLGGGPAENQSGFDIAKLHAYALARTGRVAEALATIAPEIPRFGNLPLWDQCELLHLLGQIMQRQGRIALTVRYLMHERALNPPAQHRRLHNRQHLYNAIREAHPGDLEFALQIAKEGLDLAREADDDDLARFFADQLAWTACYTSDIARLRAALEDIGRDPGLASSRPVALATAVSGYLDPEASRGDGTGLEPAIVELRALADGDDSVAAHACAVLSSAKELPASERVALLDKAATHTDTPMAYATLLLQLLWEQENLPELKRHAENWLSSPLPFLRARAHLGLAVVSLKDGAETTAVEHLAIATAFADPAELLKSMPGAWASFPQPSLIRAGDLALELLRDHVCAVTADGASPDDGKLTGMTAIEALDRVARYLGLRGTVDEPNLRFFYLVSEKAWDGEDLDTAIVAREHLCAMLAEIESARESRAREIGWLATLYKVRGRISEAETLYQQAIELGTSVLDAGELSSLIERYGNLLHEIKDYDAAVHVKWNAIRTRKPHLDLPEFPTDAGPLRRALGLEGIPDMEAPEWALELANLTNCFQAAGHLDLAKVALGYAKRAEEAGLSLVEDPTSNPNLRHAQWLIEQLEGYFEQL